MKNKGKLKNNFLLVIISIAIFLSIVIFSNVAPTGAVTLTVTQQGWGSFISSIPLSFDHGYSKVTRIDVKADIGGRWCLAGPSVAKVYDKSNSKVSEIVLPNAGGGGTASAIKTFALPIDVKNVVVEDSGAIGTCQYIDYAEARLYYTNDAPVISKFTATPEKGIGDTFVEFTADIYDDGDPLDIKLYFDVNDIRAGTTQTSFVDTKNIETVEDAPLGGYKYSPPKNGVSTYTARLEVSDGKNIPVISEKIITIFSEDKIPPVVSVSSDKQTYFTGDTVNLAATATDNVGISAIEIYLDNALVKTCPASPCLYSTSYNSAGVHTFFATAKDLPSPPNVGTSDAKDFQVLQNYILTVAKTDEGSGVITSSLGGINCGPICFNKFASGTSVTLTATPDYGSKFEGWGGDCASAGIAANCTIIMDSQKAVYAKFSLIPCTWTQQNSGTTENLRSVSFVDVNTGWVVGDNGILIKTTDGGKTWNKQNSGSDGFLKSVYFINSNTGWVVGGGEHGGFILKTTDGGSTWIIQHRFTDVSDARSVYFIDSNIGWVLAKGILKTTDGGKSWTVQISEPVVFESIFFIDKNIGWVVGFDGNILKTTDGGSTWISKDSGTTSNLVSVYFINLNTGWAVGGGEQILKTADGGETWILQHRGTVNYINSVYFLNSNSGYAVGNIIHFLKTIDGGKTWTRQEVDIEYASFKSVYFSNSNSGWAVGSGGTILKCSIPPQQSGGRSQSQQPPPCTDKDNDGYGAKGTNLLGCRSSTTVADCNDNNFLVSPNAGEICNGIDDNCNGKIDDGLGSHEGIENLDVTHSYADAAGQKLKTKGVCQYALVSCMNGKWQWDYSAGAARYGWAYETTEGKASTNNCNDGNDNDCNGKLDCGTLQNCSPLTWASDGERSNGYCGGFCDSLAQQTCGQIGGSQGQGQGAGGGYQTGGSGE